MLEQLFSDIWCEETVSKQCREGLIVNLLKKGDREDAGNYRGITLLSVVGRVFCKILGTFFLDVEKAYDTVWRDGLWLKLWDMEDVA